MGSTIVGSCGAWFVILCSHSRSWAVVRVLTSGYVFVHLCSHPKPFPCVIKPRSKEHEALLMELAQQDA